VTAMSACMMPVEGVLLSPPLPSPMNTAFLTCLWCFSEWYSWKRCLFRSASSARNQLRASLVSVLLKWGVPDEPTDRKISPLLGRAPGPRFGGVRGSMSGCRRRRLMGTLEYLC